MNDLEHQPKGVLDYLTIITDTWFKWLGWVVIAAALNTIGVKNDNTLIKIIVRISEFWLFLYAWIGLEYLADNYLPRPSRLPKPIVHIFTMLVAMIPFLVVFFLSAVFENEFK